MKDISRILDILQKRKNFSADDQRILLQFENRSASKIFPSGISTFRSGKKQTDITALKKHRQDICKTIRAVCQAEEYEKYIFTASHRRYDGRVVKFKVNNAAIFDCLKQPMNASSFERMFKLAEQKGVFDLSFRHHIPAVTLHAAARHMTRKWPRDHMGMLPLIAGRYPGELWPGLVQLAQAYCTEDEVKAFERIFARPEDFAKNRGISHVFWQKDDGSLIRDKRWKMNQRIESHGELLRYLAFHSRMRLLNTSDDLPEAMIMTITRLTHYLYLLGTSPQSCGPWEELPFTKGINWDNASVVAAMQNVLSLTAELKKHTALQKRFHRFEQTIVSRFERPAVLTEPEKLQTFINRSLQEIRSHCLQEFRGITNRIDSSSVMLAAENLNLCGSPSSSADIKKHLRILRRFEKNLVHEFGAWRYNRFKVKINNQEITSCDSYLNLNYYTLCDCRGGIYLGKHDKISYFDDGRQQAPDKVKGRLKDTERQRRMISYFEKRNAEGNEACSAQWGLPLSYAALAFCRLAAALLHKKKAASVLTDEERELLAECMNSAEEYIKRTYGTITGCKPNGELFYKADGSSIMPWRKPEAYQAVSSGFRQKKFSFIPGVNDHLGWDASKCYEASLLFLDNLRTAEELSEK